MIPLNAVRFTDCIVRTAKSTCLQRSGVMYIPAVIIKGPVLQPGNKGIEFTNFPSIASMPISLKMAWQLPRLHRSNSRFHLHRHKGSHRRIRRQFSFFLHFSTWFVRHHHSLPIRNNTYNKAKRILATYFLIKYLQNVILNKRFQMTGKLWFKYNEGEKEHKQAVIGC